MYQTGKNRVRPKAARACPNPGRLDILRTNFFLDLKLSAMVPLIIFYNCCIFKQNLMDRRTDGADYIGPAVQPPAGRVQISCPETNTLDVCVL